jgi:tetratricopeptide (TPR) repeat protein
MRRICLLGLGLALFFLTLASARAQAPSVIQIFMPNGGMPSQVIRFTLAREDGLTETVFTDSKGRYQIRTPGNQTFRYTATIDGDRQTYETTTLSFTINRNAPNFITVFLAPPAVERLPPNSVLDVTNFEGNVPPMARSAYKQATEAIGKDDLDEAIRDLQRAISLYPKYVRALNDLGVVFLRLNRLDEAASTFREAINISKRFFHPRMNLGLALNRQRKYKEAVEVLGPLYEENHGMLEVRLGYASALMGSGELAKAEEIYRAALAAPKLSALIRASTHFRLGVILNRQGRFADAVVELEKSIAINPDAANSHLQLGGALMQLQQLARAESELLRAYELAGSSAGGAQLMLGQLYYTQHKYGDAQRAFEQYLKDIPSAPNVSEITQLVATLKANLKRN